MERLFIGYFRRIHIVFKHILITTDGSQLGNKAIKTGLDLAKALGARVTVYQATEASAGMYVNDGYAVPADLLVRMEQEAGKSVEVNLEKARKALTAAGIECNTVVGKSPIPWEGIVETAKKKKCDAIVMTSHGRRGLSGVLLGSVTQKVLTHSKIPVVVFR